LNLLYAKYIFRFYINAFMDNANTGSQIKTTL